MQENNKYIDLGALPAPYFLHKKRNYGIIKQKH